MNTDLLKLFGPLTSFGERLMGEALHRVLFRIGQIEVPFSEHGMTGAWLLQQTEAYLKRVGASSEAKREVLYAKELGRSLADVKHALAYFPFPRECVCARLDDGENKLQPLCAICTLRSVVQRIETMLGADAE